MDSQQAIRLLESVYDRLAKYAKWLHVQIILEQVKQRRRVFKEYYYNVNDEADWSRVIGKVDVD